MNPQIQTRDLRLFKVGQVVTIPDCPEFRETKILAINDSGVYVSSNGFPYCVISGKSPAIPFEENKTVILDPELQKMKFELEELKKEAKKKGIAVITSEQEPNNDDDISTVIPITKSKRGSFTEKMKNLTMPDGKFTIAQLADLNDIPLPYAAKYAKEHLVEVGKVEKKEGQRGKTASLFESN